MLCNNSTWYNKCRLFHFKCRKAQTARFALGGSSPSATRLIAYFSHRSTPFHV